MFEVCPVEKSVAWSTGKSTSRKFSEQHVMTNQNNKAQKNAHKYSVGTSRRQGGRGTLQREVSRSM